MSTLIEVVFEDVFFDTIGKLLKELSKAGKHILNYSLSADWEIESEIDWHSSESITKSLLKGDTSGWSFFINLNQLNIDNLSIDLCGIQVLQYDSKYDISINFELKDIHLRHDDTDIVDTLMRFSRSIASKYGIKHYFAGLEPASDEDTRLFTNGTKGPLDQLPVIRNLQRPKKEDFVSKVYDLVVPIDSKLVIRLQNMAHTRGLSIKTMANLLIEQRMREIEVKAQLTTQH